MTQPFVRQSLSLMSGLATELDCVLRLILREAIARTGADAGASIYLLDQPGRQVFDAAAIDGRSVAVPLAPAATPPFQLFRNSRSVSSMPVREGTRTFAVLAVESSRPEYFDAERTHALEAVARDSVPAIARCLLRRRAARAGIPIDIVGSSAALAEVERQTRCAAQCGGASVLITGERGTGKELIATAVHLLSDRHEHAFLPVLCSAFSDGLFADELFGHERFAFTGAAAEREGKFKTADGGTVFLDEVADLQPDVQAALLRILERGELPRVGRDRPIRVDVRVVAATNREVPLLIGRGSFRHDLYDRLSLFEINIPPLRERKSDIRALAAYYLRKHCAAIARHSVYGAGCPGCRHATVMPCATAAFFDSLEAYDWPGNVRELTHVLLRTIAMHPDEQLDVHHLPARVRDRSPSGPKGTDAPIETLDLNQLIDGHIQRVLRMANGNKSQTARLLGIPRSTLLATIRRVRRQTGAPISSRS